MKYFKYSAFAVFYFMANMLCAQNFVYNGSFENGDLAGASYTAVNPDHYYYDPSTGSSTSIYLTTANHLDVWKRSTDDHLYHSPDWFRKGAPSNNFASKNVNDLDNAHGSYSEIFPHSQYGMLGLSAHELIQQKFDDTGLKNKLSNTNWNTITLKFWVHAANRLPPSDLTLRVYLASGDMKYKDNSPYGTDSTGDFWSGIYNQYYCPEDYKKYKTLSPIYREEILTIPNVGTVYTRGQWHLVEYTFPPPSNLNFYDWIMFDLGVPDDAPEEYCGTGYLFIDDVELLVGCDDGCSRTDGAISDPVVGTTINASNAFSMSNGIDNLNSLRLEVFASTGSLAVFDETVTCINGLDHILYWDGTNASGVPVANGYWQYRVTTQNDCGSQVFTGTLLKETNYTGTNVTNFDVDCANGVNVTPEPCCWEEPTFYINNKTLVGPDPGWSEYIIPEHIWACTAQPDYSDEVVVSNDARVLFRAGKQITLREGFNVKKGAVFLAELDACPQPESFSGGSNSSTLVSTSTELVKEPASDAVKIYPNPVSQSTTVELSNFDPSKGSYLGVLYDMTGRRLQTFEMTEATRTLDFSTYPNGIYLLQIENQQVQHRVKIVKQQ